MEDEPPDQENETHSRDRESATATERQPDAPPVLELDTVFTALSHPRRRYLLYALINEDHEETLSELATKIVAWEQSKSTDEVADEERRQVHLSLYHSHVPKLADLGIVEYQQGKDIVVRARNTEQVQAVLNGAGAELDQRQENHARRKDVTETETITGDDDASRPE